MKITKAKLRQIVLEEAVKLGKVVLNEWDYTASTPPVFDEEPATDDFNLIDTISDAGKGVGKFVSKGAERVGEFASDTYEAGKDAVKDAAVKVATDLAGGEFGQDSYGLDGGERDIEGVENRSYQRRVAPHLEVYNSVAEEYNINPSLLVGLMMDHDIRQFPNRKEAGEQVFDYWPTARGALNKISGVSPAAMALSKGGDFLIDRNAKAAANEFIAKKRAKDGGTEETHPPIRDDQNWADMSPEQQRIYKSKKKQPSVGFGGMKMDNVIMKLSDPNNINPKTKKPWINLDKELGIADARNQSDITSLVGTWLLKPENSIRAAGAFLAFEKSKNKNATDAQLASNYMLGYTPDKGGPRGQLAVKMGQEWLNRQPREQVKEAVRAALKEFL